MSTKDFPTFKINKSLNSCKVKISYPTITFETVKQLKLDVQALKHELKVQTDMVRRRRKEVTVTRTQASAKSEPCGNIKKEMAKLTMSKEDRNTCNYFGVPVSLKYI